MVRIRLSTDGVTASAMLLIDRGGYDALTLSAVAEQLGVRPSALYSHVDGLDGLRAAVAVESTRRLTAAVRDAAIGTAGDEAMRAVARAYRDYARDHPAQFEATVQLRSSSPGASDVRRELESVFTLLSRARGVHESESEAAGRNARSAIHGFLVLHRPEPTTAPDHEFDALIAAVCRMLGPAD